MELLRNELDYWIVDVNTFGPFPRNKLEVVNDVFMKPIAKLVVPHIYNQSQPTNDDFFSQKLKEFNASKFDFCEAYYKNRLQIIKSNFDIVSETHLFTLRHG